MNRHGGHRTERDGTDEMGGCAAFGPLLEAYYHHALEPHAAQSVAEHAAGCALCGTALTRFAATDRLIADAPVPAPEPELRQRLAARIATARPSRSVGLRPSAPIERMTVVHDVSKTNDINDSQRTRPAVPAHARKGVQRLRVFLGTAAAVLIVALLAGTLLTRMHATPGQITNGPGSYSPPKGVCAPGKISAQLPANTWLNELAMVSPDEGWAVGSISSTASSRGGGAISPTPDLQQSAGALILRFRNCAWTPVATNYPGARLMSISMDSANDGWAVGNASGKPLALHYTNGAWTSVALSQQSAPQGSYAQVRMRSADEGWIVVESQSDQMGNTSSGLLHLANGQWSGVNAPIRHVADVLPAGQDDAWVAGVASVSPLTPALYHYHAGQWTPTTLPSGVFIDRMRMDSPTNIWASAHIVVPVNSEGSQPAADVLHYDGATWSKVNLGKGGDAQLVQSFGASAAWAFNLQRSDAGETISRMQYGAGSTWRAVNLPLDDLLDVSSLAQVTPDEYWAIGHYVAHGTGNVASALLYFASGSWHAYGQ